MSAEDVRAWATRRTVLVREFWPGTKDFRRLVEVEVGGAGRVLRHVCERCGATKPADESCGCFDNGCE